MSNVTPKHAASSCLRASVSCFQYDFHKIDSKYKGSGGVTHCQRFQHQHFVENRPDLLPLIQRKASRTKAPAKAKHPSNPESSKKMQSAYQRLCSKVAQMEQKINLLTQQNKSLYTRQQALYREWQHLHRLVAANQPDLLTAAAEGLVGQKRPAVGGDVLPPEKSLKLHSNSSASSHHVQSNVQAYADEEEEQSSAAIKLEGGDELGFLSFLLEETSL